MTDDPLHIGAGELTADEIIDEMRSGRRVLVSVELFGDEEEVALRHDGDTYYCDTPTRLHKHPDEEGMRTCIENMGYGAVEN